MTFHHRHSYMFRSRRRVKSMWRGKSPKPSRMNIVASFISEALKVQAS